MVIKLSDMHDALKLRPDHDCETLCYGPELGFFVGNFGLYTSGGGSWESDGEYWFAAEDQVTHWIEVEV